MNRDAVIELAERVKNCRKCTRRQHCIEGDSNLPEPFLGEGCFNAQVVVLGLFPGGTFKNGRHWKEYQCEIRKGTGTQEYLDRRLYVRQFDWGNRYFPVLAEYFKPLVNGKIASLHPHHDFYYSDWSRCPGEYKSSDSMWRLEELPNCFEHTIDLLEIIQPELIVCVGTTIIEALAQSGIDIKDTLSEFRYTYIKHPNARIGARERTADLNKFWEFVQSVEFRDTAETSCKIHTHCPVGRGSKVTYYFPEIMSSESLYGLQPSRNKPHRSPRPAISDRVNYSFLKPNEKKEGTAMKEGSKVQLHSLVVAHTRLDNAGGYENLKLGKGFESGYRAWGFRESRISAGSLLLRYSKVSGMNRSAGFFELMSVSEVKDMPNGKVWLIPGFVKTFPKSLVLGTAIYGIPQIAIAIQPGRGAMGGVKSFTDVTAGADPTLEELANLGLISEKFKMDALAQIKTNYNLNNFGAIDW